MYRITLSPATREQLLHYSQRHAHPLVRRRMLAVHLVAHGHTRTEVAHLLHITPKTVRAHLQLYRTEGLDGLLTLKYPRRQGALEAQQERIRPLLEAHPPATVKEAQALIAEHTQVKRCYTQVQRFLKKIRLSVGRSGNCLTGQTAMPK